MIVISDMMGTLTEGSPVLGLVNWVRSNQSKLQAQLYMASIAPAYFLARKGWINRQAWGQNLMIESLGLIRNATPEKFSQIAEWIVEYDLWPKRRQDVIDRLTTHAKQGDQVYIASSVMEPVAQAFANRIGVQAMGSPVEYKNGRILLTAGLVASDRKIQQVLKKLNQSRVDFAYGDTEMDIPLLEHADHPVAVYPDQKLRSLALERSWEIHEQ